MAKVGEQYAGGGAAVGGEGTRHFRTDRENNASVILGLGGKATAADTTNLAECWHAAKRENCGFTPEVGNLANVNAILEEWALVMQHMESYKRFVRHATTEVV